MIKDKIADKVTEAFKELFCGDIELKSNSIQDTRKDFEGDYTINVFPFLKVSRKKPEETAQMTGDFLKRNMEEIEGYNVVKGFLNLIIDDDFWKNTINCGLKPTAIRDNSKPFVIEFSSPNTNKPLHLGHIRNNLLGASLSNIVKANGHNVEKVNLVNDRGIHICKTMLAWQKWGDNKTPVDLDMKGDKFVGDLYVLFDQKNKHEAGSRMPDAGKGENDTELMQEAREMLKKWEEGDEVTRTLWKQMNDWVYEGFDKTYNRLGIEFDKIYYESDTYLLGKKLVEEGLDKGILFKKEDGSVWCDLTDEGLDEKILLRADGTSVYMTQDLGTAQLRYDDFHPDKLLYVVGNEQNYHFDVLRIVMKKLGREWAENIVHVSYGMVELPSGKMKSREGTVVDADDLMDEMYDTAKKMGEELGKSEGLGHEETAELYNKISLGALKYFILKVDPKKNMVFNPEESIDFQGNTGPFIQYTYARIQSLLRKGNFNIESEKELNFETIELSGKENEVIKLLYTYPEILSEAGEKYSPAVIANYAYELAREFNQFYQEMPILKAENEQLKEFRLLLSYRTANMIQEAMGLLGIEVPERM